MLKSVPFLTSLFKGDSTVSHLLLDCNVHSWVFDPLVAFHEVQNPWEAILSQHFFS